MSVVITSAFRLSSLKHVMICGNLWRTSWHSFSKFASLYFMMVHYVVIWVFIDAFSASMPLVPLVHLLTFGAFSASMPLVPLVHFLILGAFGASMCLVPCVLHVLVMPSCVCCCCFVRGFHTRIVFHFLLGCLQWSAFMRALILKMCSCHREVVWQLFTPACGTADPAGSHIICV